VLKISGSNIKEQRWFGGASGNFLAAGALYNDAPP